MAKNTDETFEVVEQDDELMPLASKVKHYNVKEVKERVGPDTDKPAVLLSTIQKEIKTQLGKDSIETLHGFHLNGRNLAEIHGRTKEILQDVTKVKLLLVKAPLVEPDGSDYYLMVKMFIEWGKAIFHFLGKQRPEGDFLVFIKDITSNNIYMPCCHDVKPIAQNQLVSHFISCLQSKIDGSKCAFCNSTDLVSNTYSTVNFKKEHVTQNVHINSIYLVLDYVRGGLKMVDVRVSDSYIAARPFANYFLRNDGSHFGYNGLVDFLKAHIPTWQIERTPLYSMLTMYKRKAVNSKKDGFIIPCEECDCTFPTLTGFYLGKILNLAVEKCQCEEGSSYLLPISKIDELYDLAKKMVLKDESNATKSVLISLFDKKPGDVEVDLPINLNLDLDQLINANKLTTNTTVISGSHSNDISSKNVSKQQITTQATPLISTTPKSVTPTTTSSISFDASIHLMESLNAGNQQNEPVNKKRKSSDQFRVGRRIITSTFSRGDKFIIHTANDLARTVHADFRNDELMSVLDAIYDDHFVNCDEYNERSYQLLLAKFRRKVERGD